MSTPTEIGAQIGAAQGLWTHTPVDYAGNDVLGGAPAGAPKDAINGYLGMISRPGGVITQSGPPGAPVISAIQLYGNVGTTTCDIIFICNPAPTSCRINYSTDQTNLSLNKAGTATSGSQLVTLTGLTSGTQYWAQVQATNANGTTLTVPLTFRTK